MTAFANQDPVALGWTPLLELLPQGAVLADAAGRCVEANPAAGRILGAGRDELLGRSLEDLLGEDRPWLQVAVHAAPVGGRLAMIEDVTEARAQKVHLERMTRLYAALSQVNQAIVWSASRDALFAKICEVMAEFGKFSMAWIGWNDPVTREVAIVSRYGDTEGYLDGLSVRSDDSPLGSGPAGTAIRTGRTCVFNDFLGSPACAPWHGAARRCGFASLACFPIHQGGAVAGILAVYAPEKDVFGPHEVALLEEAAGDISFALDHLELDARRRAAEEALRESQARLHRAESVAAFGNWELSLDDQRMHASHGARLIYGLGGGKLAYTEAKTLVLPEFRPRMDEAMRDLVERGRPYNVEFRIRRASDGEVRTVHSLAEYDPVRRTVFGVLQDITAARQAEQENARLHAELVQSQKMESLGLLAGGVAHDMNNVLGAVLALASAHLTLEPAGSPAWRAFETIEAAALRGGNVVRSLLNFARKSTAEVRLLDLNAILEEQARLLERTTLARIRLVLDLEPALHAVHGDGGAMAHAVLNLCLNAVDAMPAGGTLTLRTRNADSGRVEIHVEDTGSGMTREVRDRALDPFFTTKEVGKGTGLGLAMVYATVKAHQGTLDLASEPGDGTRVTLRLPATPALPGPGAHGGLPAPGTVRPLSVFLVDDDPLVLSSTRLLVEVLGHRIRTATSGEEALALLDGGFDPDAVILDLNMPGLGGLGTLSRLRERRPALPVLIATGQADQEALDLAAAHPRAALLAKPFTIQELQAQLQRMAE